MLPTEVIPGIKVLPEYYEPSGRLPENIKGLRIGLVMVGGVGDTAISIGASSKRLRQEGAYCIAIANKSQHEMLYTMGLDKCMDASKFRETRNTREFDVIINFAKVFNTKTHLKSRDYYSLVSERLGREVEPGEFNFSSPVYEDTVALHPGASNPNRRWPQEYWHDLAYELRNRGQVVCWLGTQDEYGFNDRGIIKLSDVETRLLPQIKILAKCAYFIGADSGFTHVAGILEKPGLALFANTRAENVIGRYPIKSLQAPGDSTHSLDPECRQSHEQMRSITVEDVLRATPFKKLSKNRWPERTSKPVRQSISVSGDIPPSLKEFLSNHYTLTNQTHFPQEAKVWLAFSKEGCKLCSPAKQAYLKTDDYDAILRAIREFSV